MTSQIWLARLCRVGLAALLASQLHLAGAQVAAPVTGAASAARSRAAAPQLPIEFFANLPLVSNLTLSPDGQRIAALLNQPHRTLLITRAIDGQESQVVLQSDNDKYIFKWARWVNNDRLVVSVRYAARRNSVGTVETRLLSVKADGSGVVNLVRHWAGGTRGMGIVARPAQLQDQVLDWLPEDGKHVLLQLQEGETGQPAVYKVNVDTGDRKLVHPPERKVEEWITDAQHRVRVGIRTHEDELEIRACDPDGQNWRTLWRFRGFEAAVWPLGFGRDPQELFVRTDHEGRAAVFSVRLDQPDLPRRLRLSHPRYDVDGELMYAPKSGEVLGLRGDGTDNERGETRSELWEPQWRALAQSIDKGLPERSNRLLDITADETHYLLFSSGNGQPGEYYLGERATGNLTLLAETHPSLPVKDLVGKHVVRIKARDGLNLSAFLSLPAGRGLGDAGSRLPLVLLPHGGPHSRDGDDFDTWTEFLANRGYAVLQVNFRGSDGYGREFKKAGLGRWGLEMQDDLTDGVQWAIDRGIADAGRVCIVGASYGGYAALMGAVKTPELYRCAASFAGVSDLPELILHHGDYRGGRIAAERQIGDMWNDRARLRATSPALHAERIRVPVLLVHGTADRVVPVDQSEGMAKALRRANKPYLYIEQEGGDHHLSRNPDRLQFFKALEKFLAENLNPVIR
jgi:dipeptidyl aminopeptidase/acylaminoacyl peptidase